MYDQRRASAKQGAIGRVLAQVDLCMSPPAKRLRTMVKSDRQERQWDQEPGAPACTPSHPPAQKSVSGPL